MPTEVEIQENSVLVILGASGDLAKKKLYPALFGLERRSLLPASFQIIGFAPDKIEHEEFVKLIKSPIKLEIPRHAEQLAEFSSRCSYVSGHEGGDKAFQALQKRLEELGHGKKEQNRLFYLALPPSVFVLMSEQLKKHCYSKRGDTRIIIEKPFGHDLESSRDLQKALDPNWREDEIFRVDHYLGKEVVNNLLVMRFGNEIFGSIWNCRHIDSVEVSITEAGGAEGRGSYFNRSGAIRDVMQNHMTQILALLTMERPRSFSANDLCNEKVRVLSWMPPIAPTNTLVGQYGPSTGGSKPAFKDEEDVPNDSRCVTFCAAIAHIDNERWSGVPFLLKAGKALNESKTIITINFLPSPNTHIFGPLSPNQLTIRIQPDEGVFLKINSFRPTLGPDTKIEPTDLDLTYRGREIPEAYEALLLDALKGDYSRSVRRDELDESWRVWTPLLHFLDEERDDTVPIQYPYGSTGPEGLGELMESHRHKS
ncbi:Glucose-6-phosphate 1-dehydrogenase [Mycoblastus sanguinarius]|nr:Glucose-6-phosphate 1-dehydrogenase [Mycoblastus sanguinarius]